MFITQCVLEGLSKISEMPLYWFLKNWSAGKLEKVLSGKLNRRKLVLNKNSNPNSNNQPNTNNSASQPVHLKLR